MISEATYNQYLQYLIEGNRRKCSAIVESLLEEEIELKVLYRYLFQRSLYKIGEMWEYNKISVAVEHLATSITQQLMNLVYPQLFVQDKNGKKAVITCVANEYHQIGPRMVADFFELNGWDGFFLGSDTPINDLLEYIENQQPDIVALSLAIYFNMKILYETIETIREKHPCLPVLVGGQAFRWGGHDVVDRFDHVRYLESIETLDQLFVEGDFG